MNNFIIIIGVFLIAIGTLLTYYGTDRKSKETNKQLNQSINAKNNQIDDLVVGKNELIAQNTKLSLQIEKYQQDLQEKEEKIKELDKKAKMVGRGVTSVYDFQGIKRQTSAGKITAVAGQESEVFQQITALEQAKNYPALIEICEQQIKKTPDWLTPYLYLGVAQANTGLKDEAIKNIRYVVNTAPEDPQYAEANKILKQLEQQP